ncbi:MAG: tRNA (adenosine(37)-N6)-threonylcarbamoyltransferase complex transferase subunit TsaD, partial [Peptococcaceae bacterium]|nr:tRNA (adenosine(37)-N6)-threonylcarbamoyltransferase complex transferase subunit TsaD [Peptococcaceae bacterium]
MSVIILALETSCDETSAAVVADGTKVLSNIISSQIDVHRKFGGVVPEVASRKHLELINQVAAEALTAADMGFSDLSAVAVTYGPGLVGALLVGVAFAKAMAYGLDLPLIGVNHLEGHIYANFLSEPGLEFPILCLVVSGGHTDLVYIHRHGDCRVIGRTRDDAAGEAFDKVARVIGLGYPGG